MILYKYGVFAEAIDIPSLVPHIVHEDKENSELFKLNWKNESYIPHFFIEFSSDVQKTRCIPLPF